jgi:hypothetical protein
MDWHRLFGLLLADFFADSPYVVELEKDLSIKRQLLDVVILRKREGRFDGRLPDGLEDLAAHNLITFKSHHEALDDWALKELTGHYVNYRKQVSPSFEMLLSEDEFRLFGVCARFPQNLARHVNLEEVNQGIYDCRRGSDRIRIIVAGRVSDESHNAVWQLFSASPEQVQSGAAHYQMRSAEASTLLGNLFQHYRVEGFEMPYTMEDYRRDYVKEHLKRLSAEERLEGLPPEERLKGLPPEERLKGLPPEERLKGLPPEERLKGLPPEERLRGLSVEELARIREEVQKLLEAGGKQETKVEPPQTETRPNGH